MKRIEINGIVIEFDDSVSIEIENGKVTVKGNHAEPQETHFYHHWHWHPGVPLQTWPYQSITCGTLVNVMVTTGGNG